MDILVDDFELEFYSLLKCYMPKTFSCQSNEETQYNPTVPAAKSEPSPGQYLWQIYLNL